MRSRSLARIASCQDVCFFCAFRATYSASIAAPWHHAQTRTFNVRTLTQSQSGAATAHRNDDGGSQSPPSNAPVASSGGWGQMGQNLGGIQFSKPLIRREQKPTSQDAQSSVEPAPASNTHLRDIIPPRRTKLSVSTTRSRPRHRSKDHMRPSFLDRENTSKQASEEVETVGTSPTVRRVSRRGQVGGLEELENLTSENAKLMEKDGRPRPLPKWRRDQKDFESAHSQRRKVADSTHHWTPNNDIVFNRREDETPDSATISQLDSRQSRRASRFEDSDIEGKQELSLSSRTRSRYRGRGADRDYGGMDDDEYDEEFMGRSKSKKKKKKREASLDVETTPQVAIPEFISVESLAKLLRIRIDDFIARLEGMGFESPNHDHILDGETAGLIATEHNFTPVMATSDVPDLVARPSPEDKSILPPRPPIITIMGHVDHGKTTILDYLRKSSVAASEHGGITQHIGAFSVQLPGVDRLMTFLDTPGHAAFLEMRRRGANVTDIVVLVVAADDGVKPQTIEAIKHALDANVQIIVAINKIDKHDANPETVKQELTRHGIEVEDLGGNIQAIAVSGKTGQGMQDLEEAILALSEAEDYRAELDGPAEGWVIEANVTQAGKLATVLVRRGTMRPGDYIVAGTTWARIRSLRTDAGQLIEEAPPGTPVQIDGWRDQPQAGFEVLQAESEQHAKEVVELRVEREEFTKMTSDASAINVARKEEAEQRAKILAWESEQEWAKKSVFRRPKDNEGWVEPTAKDDMKRLNIVVKADVTGSVEAVVNALSSLGNNEVATNIIRSGVGPVSLSDIQHVSATGVRGYIVSFNQTVDGEMYRLAENADVEILDHNIIYRMTDAVKEKLADLLPPIIKHKVHGEAEIGQVFEITAKKELIKIAGCKVTNGTISRERPVRVSRYNQVIFDGKLSSLKNVKKDVTEMRKGSECGMGFDSWQDFMVGDSIQSYEELREKRKL